MAKDNPLVTTSSSSERLNGAFKVLIIQQKMIGDVLTSSILFEALKKRYPESELHYLIHAHTKPVVENNPFIDKLILFSEEENKKSFAFFQFLKSIKKEKYDVVIDVYAKINSALISYASRAKIRISYKKSYTQFAYTHTFHQKKHLETNAGFAIENRMLLLKGLGSDFPIEIKPKLYLTSEEKNSAKDVLIRSGINLKKPLFMISVLGSSENKTYPIAYLAELLNFIVVKTDGQLLFNYIPKQEKEVNQLYELCTPETKEHILLNIYGKSLREFMAITSHCDALIGNEGGAVNMAKALKIPTFAIFSPQIKKESWNIYEDKLNVAVHLKDFKPEFFPLQKKQKKEPKKFYQIFKPEYILTELNSFLLHSKKKSD